jgi:hypothetical protein
MEQYSEATLYAIYIYIITSHGNVWNNIVKPLYMLF